MELVAELESLIFSGDVENVLHGHGDERNLEHPIHHAMRLRSRHAFLSGETQRLPQLLCRLLSIQ